MPSERLVDGLEFWFWGLLCHWTASEARRYDLLYYGGLHLLPVFRQNGHLVLEILGVESLTQISVGEDIV